MQIKTLFPLTAAAFFALSVSAVSLSGDREHARGVVPAHSRIVDLPAITVRPAAADAAYQHANKIVDLAAVTVRPQAQDAAYVMASREVRVVDLPVVSVSPRAEVQAADVATVAMTHQVASR